MAYSKAVCEALWTEALNTEHGIAITPEDGDIRGLRTELYRTRELLMDARLHTLAVHVDPDGKELWLCKKLTNQ